MANRKYVSLSKLQTFLDNLKGTFASLVHKHTLNDITDYEIDSALSSTSSNPVQNKVLDAEFEVIANSMNALDLAIDSKANANHTHDDRYYTETEIDTKLSDKANSTHTHSISDVTNLQTTITNLQTTLNSKAASSHTHKVADISDLTATATELNYVDGVTSNIQTQLNAKQATITGGATTIASSNLTANRTLISNSSGKVAVSAITSTELGHLDGVTSNIQTQLNSKSVVKIVRWN